ncbi:MAG: hypothetical protein WCJ35_15450 [Planctomycetota bacterium]
MTEQNNSVNENSAPAKPFWMPPGVALENLSEELGTVIRGVLMPAYEKLVVAARPGLEQSTGMTIVHLLWLEALQQTELGQDLMGSGHESERLQKHERSIARLLRLAGSKMKASDFLLRLFAYRHKLMTGSGAAGLQLQPTPAGDSQPPT